MNKVAHWQIDKRLGILMIFLVLSGCSAASQSQQAALTEEHILSMDQPIGQSFVARFDGLSGIYFHLSPGEAGDGEIALHLRTDPQANQDLAVSYTTVPLQSISGSGIYGFFVPAQIDSNQKYYYAFLEVKGSGSVEVGVGPGDSYLDGALYRNHTPQDAQAVFQLSYSRRNAAIGLIKEFTGWIGILLVAGFLYVLPGWGLLSVFLSQWKQLHWAEKAGLSAGLSLALYPILIVWTDLIGLHLGVAYAWIPPLLGGYLLAWDFTRQGIALRVALRQLRIHAHPEKLWQSFWPNLTLLTLLAMVVFTRFWVIRSLEAPMWGDGYQHTMITQLLADHNGLFTSWQPYAELTTFTYHFGFHSAAVAFHWITGQDSGQAVLWVGQILNVLAVLALYPLATKVSGNRWAGTVAILVAGVLSPMPMDYINWGRYTQLAGQAMLPIVVWITWKVLDSDKLDWRTLLLGWLAWGGLALAHYRVLIMGGVFIAVYWLFYLRPTNWQRILKATFGLGVGATILFLPWFVRVFGGRLMIALGIELTTPASAVSAAIQEYNGFGDLTTYLPAWLWLFLVLCLGRELWRQRSSTALISLWCVLLVLVANPYWVGLPGAGAINNFALLIALYIPASLIIGSATATGLEVLRSFLTGKTVLFRISMAIILMVTLTIGLREAFSSIQADTSPYGIVTRPDLQAARWIQNSLPPDAKLAVNSFSAFTDTSVVGSDGGWWMPLLAQRQTTLPPLLYVSEQGVTTDYPQDIMNFNALMHEKGINSVEVLEQLKHKGVTHIYIGQRQGRVNNPEGGMEPELLLTDAHFQLLYHQDRVWVFEFLPGSLTPR